MPILSRLMILFCMENNDNYVMCWLLTTAYFYCWPCNKLSKVIQQYKICGLYHGHDALILTFNQPTSGAVTNNIDITI